ncbi:MAG: hypothetical protein OHK0039_46220 [Bacteroidia bacterium]
MTVCLSALGAILPRPGWAQLADLRLGVAAYQGQTIKHSPKMVFDLPSPARALSVEVSWQSDGRHPWHAWHGYPRLGWTAGMLDYGHREVLGRAYGFFPHMDLPLLRRSRGQLYVRLGYGLAWLDKTYDPQTNPINNAIGSHLNNFTQLGLVGDICLVGPWVLQTGLCFAHNSNARLQVPNLGLNTAAVRLGLQYRVTAPGEGLSYRRTQPVDRPLRRWGGFVRVGLAAAEAKVANGPKYPVYIVMLGGDYAWRAKGRVLAGLEYSQDWGIAHFYLNQDIPPRQGNRSAGRYALYGGHEFLFGRMGIQTLGFLYLNDPLGNTPAWGLKLGPMLYLRPSHAATRFNAFAGIYLKSHLFDADFAELTIGLRM